MRHFLFSFFLEFSNVCVTLYAHPTQYLTRSGVFYEQTKQGIELLFPRRTSLRKRTGCDDDLFIDFVSKLLEVDPSKRCVYFLVFHSSPVVCSLRCVPAQYLHNHVKPLLLTRHRPTAEEALRHPWLQVDYGPIPALS